MLYQALGMLSLSGMYPWLKLLLLVSVCFAAKSGYFQKPQRQLVREDAHGGTTRGDFFNDNLSQDSTLIGNFASVRSLTISYSDQVESIQVDYVLSNKTIYQAERHGTIKNINPPVKIRLTPGEYIQKIVGTTNGVLVDQLTIITYNPKNIVTKKYGPYGKPGKTTFSFNGYILIFYGRSGDMLDSIGVYHFPPAIKSAVFGKNDKSLAVVFDENPDTGYFPPVVKINKLIIYHAGAVYSIQAQYQLLDGSIRLGQRIGGIGLSSSPATIVKFEKDEEILGIEGTVRTDSNTLCQLSFISRRDNVSNPTLYNGPFGWPCPVETTSFSVKGNVLGFFGTSDGYSVLGLGVYYS